MSGTTRPIPISLGHRSQRSSPSGTINAGASDADAGGVSPNGMISQSCPVNGRGATFFRPHHQPPPRAPVIGSLPEPSFLLGGALDTMPELVLPPPAQFEGDSGEGGAAGSLRREASVVQVASSCPVDIGFFRPGPSAHQRSWAPSPRASDEFDLSKSPALAVMSAMRQGRRPSFDQPQEHHGARSFGISGSSRRISDPPFRPPASNSFVSSSFHFFGDDRVESEIQSQQFGMENLSLDGTASSPPLQPPQSAAALTALNEPGVMGLPPRRPERRGSYDGGIFLFEDQ